MAAAPRKRLSPRAARPGGSNRPRIFASCSSFIFKPPVLPFQPSNHPARRATHRSNHHAPQTASADSDCRSDDRPRSVRLDCRDHYLLRAAETVRIPAGTTIYCVLDQDLSTKRKLSSFVQEGENVRALVADDVVVDGRIVIEAGTVVWSKISKAKRAKIAGIKGKLEVESTTVEAIDGTTVNLRGGYDRSGKGRKSVSIALAAVVAWPLIFIKGKQAFLDRGVVFDAQASIPDL